MINDVEKILFTEAQLKERVAHRGLCREESGDGLGAAGLLHFHGGSDQGH